MFNRAKSKLEDSRTIYSNLQTCEDIPAFRALFNSFLQSSRSITNALQKEGKQLPEFTNWYLMKQDEMRNDELLRFMHIARTEDFHEGKHRLRFSTHIQYLDTSSVGPPPSPTARLGISNEGLFWIMNKGTPREERIPIKDRGEVSYYISIDNPPTSHLGHKLENNNPLVICQLTLAYFSNLIIEAEEKFSAQ